jgi:hypothetical protein
VQRPGLHLGHPDQGIPLGRFEDVEGFGAFEHLGDGFTVHGGTPRWIGLRRVFPRPGISPSKWFGDLLSLKKSNPFDNRDSWTEKNS